VPVYLNVVISQRELKKGRKEGINIMHKIAKKVKRRPRQVKVIQRQSKEARKHTNPTQKIDIQAKSIHFEIEVRA
jgi:hypothetical protein